MVNQMWYRKEREIAQTFSKTENHNQIQEIINDKVFVKYTWKGWNIEYKIKLFNDKEMSYYWGHVLIHYSYKGNKCYFVYIEGGNRIFYENVNGNF